MDKLDSIYLNGVKGVDSVIDMIIDCIDDGDSESAKDYLMQLSYELAD